MEGFEIDFGMEDDIHETRDCPGDTLEIMLHIVKVGDERRLRQRPTREEAVEIARKKYHTQVNNSLIDTVYRLRMNRYASILRALATMEEDGQTIAELKEFLQEHIPEHKPCMNRYSMWDKERKDPLGILPRIDAE